MTVYVFSIMAYTATNDDLDTFHIIFMIVLFSPWQALSSRVRSPSRYL
ncbi:hypothetical protein GPK53_01760 [[Eubacterium] rectale]|nr:hypothetical protein [Agathobacter rectalis]